MKNNTILLFLAGAAMLAFASCSGTTSTTVTPSGPSTTSSFFSRHFPHIDTATLWYYNNGVRTGDFAKISSVGSMTVTCHATPSKGGHFKINIMDTTNPSASMFTYSLMSPTDTIISTGNSIGILSGADGRSYYYMQLLARGVLTGDYVDSL